MPKLGVGAQAPDFSLPDQDGNVQSLASYRGKKVALYFYPKDNTPGCTKEACSLRDGYADLNAHGIAVLGVSHDSVASHQAFAKEHTLPFTLLSDSNKEVSSLYGAKGWFGMTKRITYLIDEEGMIIKVLNDIDVRDHAQQILDAFGIKS